MMAEPHVFGRDVKRLYFDDGTHLDAHRLGGIVSAESNERETTRVHWPSVKIGEPVLLRTWKRWERKAPAERRTAPLVRAEVLK